ncbi:hypothetical protein, partial [Escherichia coli]|uniref:hypothetical protein n=1 Tax=Escherichia coli TaxID=562 RepID=UPI0019600F67
GKGKLSPTTTREGLWLLLLFLVKGDDGGNRECEELTSRSSIDTSAGSDMEVEEESRNGGEGLKGGRESREKNEGCDNDRECVGVGLMF